MLRLPVSDIAVDLRAPDGQDDLLLLDGAAEPVASGIALAGRLARTETGPIDAAALTVTDFELLLLTLRARRFGPLLCLGFACPSCSERVEVAFRIDDYLASVRPRRPSDVVADPDRPGWWRLGTAAFRLPTAGDQASVAGLADAGMRLADRCVDATARRARSRVMRAMEAMAPEVSRPIAGACPACAARVSASLHVTRVVIAELRRSASGVLDDVDAIARAYHWPKSAILAMPGPRRLAYAERLRGAAGLAA